MTKRTKNRPTLQIALFSENALTILISVATLLLQLISFATTWNGSKVYLEGVFPCASLLFAIAIQATAYFFSNSLRTKIRPLKIIALCAALCCSTYYSYIGIYNSVNSPTNYLQENYVRISHELTRKYDAELEKNLSDVREAVGAASSLITARYTSLQNERQQYADCRNALDAIEVSYTSGLRPPKQSSYDNYEDYAAAYEAYISSASQGSNLENIASREGVLSVYGFSSIEELNRLEAENTAALQALETALGTSQYVQVDTSVEDTGHTDLTSGTSVLSDISALSAQLNAAINATASGQSPDSETTTAFQQFFQAAALCDYQGMTLAQAISTLSLCADTTAAGFLLDYSALVASLPEGSVTDANTMDLKSAMDSQLLSALIKLNALLPDTEQIAFTEARYQITDLYLIPVQALVNQDTRTTAAFCLAAAALIDTLSVLFAVSLRDKKPLWKERTLLFCNLEDYAPLIYATLPAEAQPALALSEFIGHFKPSPQTEGDGYMMQAEIDTLQEYTALNALLCQLNLAKILPAGFLDNTSEVLLIKARLVFWANSIIYEERTTRPVLNCIELN